MFKLLTRILPLVIAAAASVPTAAAPSQKSRWEQIESVAPALTGDEVSVAVRDYYIYVTVERPTAVKLFTILGQPVSQATLPAGTSRFKTGARGIYILKAGSSTRRITV